jgi:hypothetical protein
MQHQSEIFALVWDLRKLAPGLTPANIGPFQLECLELASCALNLEAYFSSARQFPERTKPPWIPRIGGQNFK